MEIADSADSWHTCVDGPFVRDRSCSVGPVLIHTSTHDSSNTPSSMNDPSFDTQERYQEFIRQYSALQEAAALDLHHLLEQPEGPTHHVPLSNPGSRRASRISCGLYRAGAKSNLSAIEPKPPSMKDSVWYWLLRLVILFIVTGAALYLVLMIIN